MMVYKCRFVLFSLWCGIANGFGIQQVFPSHPSYSCPCPSLLLKCTFPVGVIAVVWSFPGSSNIPESFAFHTINNSMIANGMSYLDVNSSSTLQKSYRCIAFFPDGTTQEYRYETGPAAELTVDCFPGEINDTSIQIKWNNPYTECYSFSVLVDSTVIQNKISNKSDYTLSHLNSSTQYRVCVVARDGHGQVHANGEDCEDITTAVTNAHPNIFSDGIGILICIVLSMAMLEYAW